MNNNVARSALTSAEEADTDKLAYALCWLTEEEISAVDGRDVKSADAAVRGVTNGGWLGHGQAYN